VGFPTPFPLSLAAMIDVSMPQTLIFFHLPPLFICARRLDEKRFSLFVFFLRAPPPSPDSARKSSCQEWSDAILSSLWRIGYGDSYSFHGYFIVLFMIGYRFSFICLRTGVFVLFPLRLVESGEFVVCFFLFFFCFFSFFLVFFLFFVFFFFVVFFGGFCVCFWVFWGCCFFFFLLCVFFFFCFLFFCFFCWFFFFVCWCGVCVCRVKASLGTTVVPATQLFSTQVNFFFRLQRSRQRPTQWRSAPSGPSPPLTGPPLSFPPLFVFFDFLFGFPFGFDSGRFRSQGLFSELCSAEIFHERPHSQLAFLPLLPAHPQRTAMFSFPTAAIPSFFSNLSPMKSRRRLLPRLADAAPSSPSPAAHLVPAVGGFFGGPPQTRINEFVLPGGRRPFPHSPRPCFFSTPLRSHILFFNEIIVHEPFLPPFSELIPECGTFETLLLEPSPVILADLPSPSVRNLFFGKLPPLASSSSCFHEYSALFIVGIVRTKLRQKMSTLALLSLPRVSQPTAFPAQKSLFQLKTDTLCRPGHKSSPFPSAPLLSPPLQSGARIWDFPPPHNTAAGHPPFTRHKTSSLRRLLPPLNLRPSRAWTILQSPPGCFSSRHRPRLDQ